MMFYQWTKTVAGLLGATILAVVLISGSARALTLNSARDCDDNAVIRCGALTTQELTNRYDQPGVAEVFRCFGISSQEVANIDATAVAGHVTKAGNVVVNSKVVATDAITTGRQNMPGSTATNCGGTTFYERPPSTSFSSSSIAAFVVMNGDRFSYAILASCGNPVRATPVSKKLAPSPVPAPTPQPLPPPPTPTQVQSQSVTVNAPTPTPPPAPTPAPYPTPVSQRVLPSTGPSDVLAVGAVSTAIGSLGHYIYRRRKP